MEGESLDAQRTVLVIDRSEDTREVLKTVLQLRGLRLLEASHARAGLELTRLYRPDLIVLDVETDAGTAEEICEPFARQTQQRTPMVLIGSVRRSAPDLLPGEFVTKPYHYGPLIRRIEELLNATGQTVSRSA
jgi:DNA-binding response OmpR family regulator